MMERGWIKEVLNPSFALDYFTNPWRGEAKYQTRFERLDRALCNGLKPWIEKHHTDLSWKVIRRDKDAVFWEDKPASQRVKVEPYSGRQILWMFVDDQKVRNEMGPTIRSRQIQELTWLGDDQSEEMLRIWIDLTEDEEHLHTERALRSILFALLAASEEMRLDLQCFDRLEETDRTYQRLTGIWTRTIKRKKDRAREHAHEEEKANLFQKGGIKPLDDQDVGVLAPHLEHLRSRNAAPCEDDDDDESGEEYDDEGWDEEGGEEEEKEHDPEVEPDRTDAELKRICVYFQEGRCRRSPCRFEHDYVTGSEWPRLKQLVAEGRRIVEERYAEENDDDYDEGYYDDDGEWHYYYDEGYYDDYGEWHYYDEGDETTEGAQPAASSDD